MDLTSATRALTSLRRRGATPTELSTAEALVQAIQDKASLSDHIDQVNSLLVAEKWEPKAAAFLTAQELLKHGPSVSIGDVEPVIVAAQNELENREPRVRSSVVGLLKELSKVDGPSTWARFGDRIFELITTNFVVDAEERTLEQQHLAERSLQTSNTKISSAPLDYVPASATPPSSPRMMPSSPRPMPSSPRLDSLRKPVIAHETVGWKALETSMKSLNSLIAGYGAGFVLDGHLSEDLLRLVTVDAPGHENRYVREVAYFLCGTLAHVVVVANQRQTQRHAIDSIVLAISRGLSDNWSQVRYAASVAVRQLGVGLDADSMEAYNPVLVPRMCLNRYYLAEGVRIYNQKTWGLVFGARGPAMVAKYASEVVDYYCSQSEADNHGVREAACHCIAELGSQVDKRAISKFVPRLLSALIACFRDESWPVRDAACVACAKFVHGFPEESLGSMDALYELWFNHLSDNIWSVREDSAVALSVVMQAYPNIAVDLVTDKLKELLVQVKDENRKPQCEHNHNDQGSKTMVVEEKGKGVIAVTGKLEDLRKGNVDSRHSNQTMFSCGSLAPKLRRGVGCMDHGFSREKQPWESTDGGIYLLRELAKLHPQKAESFMTMVSDAAREKGFQGEYLLQETIWKQLPALAKALGKRPFKRYLEPFLQPMVHALYSNHQLAAHAAGYCIRQLREYLGPEIFKGRVMQAMDGDRMWAQIESSPLA